MNKKFFHKPKTYLGYMVFVIPTAIAFIFMLSWLILDFTVLGLLAVINGSVMLLGFILIGPLWHLGFLNDKIYTSIGMWQAHKVQIFYKDIDNLDIINTYTLNTKKQIINNGFQRTNNPFIYLQVVLKDGSTQWLDFTHFTDSQRVQIIETINIMTNKNFVYDELTVYMR